MPKTGALVSSILFLLRRNQRLESRGAVADEPAQVGKRKIGHHRVPNVQDGALNKLTVLGSEHRHGKEHLWHGQSSITLDAPKRRFARGRKNGEHRVDEALALVRRRRLEPFVH